jgi:hypothetical protein
MLCISIFHFFETKPLKRTWMIKDQLAIATLGRFILDTGVVCIQFNSLIAQSTPERLARLGVCRG